MLDNFDCPQLHPREHEMLESFLGRELTNTEAQDALKNATLLAAFTVWADDKATRTLSVDDLAGNVT